jgi:hypothetical protein
MIDCRGGRDLLVASGDEHGPEAAILFVLGQGKPPGIP